MNLDHIYREKEPIDYEGFRKAVSACVAAGLATYPDIEDQRPVSFRSKYKTQRAPEDEFEHQKKSVASAKATIAELKEKKVKGQAYRNAKIRLGMAERRLAKARKAMGM